MIYLQQEEKCSSISLCVHSLQSKQFTSLHTGTERSLTAKSAVCVTTLMPIASERLVVTRLSSQGLIIILRQGWMEPASPILPPAGLLDQGAPGLCSQGVNK